jgi:pilus assembly protein Flp/PilA
LSALGSALARDLRARRCAQAHCRKGSIMKDVFRKFLAAESGATAIEYGLIAAGISLAIISIVNGLGTNLRTKFTSINSSLH